MPRGKPITLPVVRRACDHYAQWGSWSAAAQHVGLSYSGLTRALKETFTEEREDAEYRHQNRIRAKVTELAGLVEGVEPPSEMTMRWALDHKISWALPEGREAQRLELSGAVEVSNPELAAAVDRFTITLRTLAERAQSSGAVRALEPGGAELVAGEAGG